MHGAGVCADGAGAVLAPEPVMRGVRAWETARARPPAVAGRHIAGYHGSVAWDQVATMLVTVVLAVLAGTVYNSWRLDGLRRRIDDVHRRIDDVNGRFDDVHRPSRAVSSRRPSGAFQVSPSSNM